MYEVSNTGLVWTRHRNAVLSPGWQTGGYFFVGLRRDGRSHNRKVHALVAEAFIGPRPCGLDVNHIDGDKRNNRVENLEYVTRQENVRHAFELGLRLRGKLSMQAANDIRADYASGATQASLAKRYGVSTPTISSVVHNKTWRAA